MIDRQAQGKAIADAVAKRIEDKHRAHVSEVLGTPDAEAVRAKIAALRAKHGITPDGRSLREVVDERLKRLIGNITPEEWARREDEQAKRDAAAAEAQRRIHLATVKARWQRLIPADTLEFLTQKHPDFRLERLHTPERAAELRRAATSSRGALIVIYGPPGTGKTLTWSMLVYLGLLAKKTVEAIKGYAFWTSYAETWDAKGPTHAQWRDGLVRPDVLVIDEADKIMDVAMKADAKWTCQTRLEEILHDRHDRFGITIVCGNFESDTQAAEMLGPKINDRMSETGLIVPMLGASKRGKGGK